MKIYVIYFSLELIVHNFCPQTAKYFGQVKRATAKWWVEAVSDLQVKMAWIAVQIKLFLKEN